MNTKILNNIVIIAVLLLVLAKLSSPLAQAKASLPTQSQPAGGTGLRSDAIQPIEYLAADPVFDKRAFLPLVTNTKITYFSLLPPGSKLPSDAECAASVKAKPENKRMNKTYNATKGSQKLPADFFGGSDPRANSQLGPRVTGNFTGTTDEILQWAACKWGVDEDMVRAQAVTESWWQQTVKGDWTSDSTRCAPGHGIGADGKPGECPESFGILQNRYPYMKGAWPGIHDSTAFNADTAYAYWRACYEGYEWWLSNTGNYAAGDAWGCMGRWFTGQWHSYWADWYIGNVQNHLNQRTWEKAEFQEP
jgi:hypothetical protein